MVRAWFIIPFVDPLTPLYPPAPTPQSSGTCCGPVVVYSVNEHSILNRWPAQENTELHSTYNSTALLLYINIDLSKAELHAYMVFIAGGTFQNFENERDWGWGLQVQFEVGYRENWVKDLSRKIDAPYVTNTCVLRNPARNDVRLHGHGSVVFVGRRSTTLAAW